MSPSISELILSPWSDYAEAQARSARIDALLGVRLEETEDRLRGRVGDLRGGWTRLSPQAFQTPYPELAEMVRLFTEVRPLRWLDLGAAYGRLGLVLSLLRPEDEFLGIEHLEERVTEGNRVLAAAGAGRARLRAEDVLAGELPDFDVAFLFDFSDPAEVSLLLERLRERAREKPFAIFGRGRGTRHLIEDRHPWLSQVEEPLRAPHWTLYRVSSRSPGPCRPPGARG